ncbi:alpha/beta fold hydrolase [Nonomuraea sp. NPDC050394]|uniref:alpha/beta fold hydrolase n=1 Tax=Nonomuraea sp. NPDC050394 TaxID=3364363 RepID=UPI0037AB2D88
MRLLINGNELEVEDLGDRDAPVIIAHHGAPGLSTRAEPKAGWGALADTYRVIVFDARGSGESGSVPPLTHDQWVADVDALRAWAGVDRVVVAGGSYGGFIALQYALRHPDRVRALLLRDTAATDDFRARARRRAEEMGRDVDLAELDRMFTGQVSDDADLRRLWLNIQPLYTHDHDPATGRAEPVTMRFRAATHRRVFGPDMPVYDIRDRLGEIGCPTLITVGRADWITPVEAGRELADGIPDSRLVIFEHSGHSPQIEERTAWLATVRAFLDDMEGRTDQ